MIAPHATPAAAYAALGEFLTDDAPQLMTAEITVEYDYGDDYVGPSLTSYTVKIHVTEDAFPLWLERHGFTDADVLRTARSDDRDTLSVTSQTGVRIFCLTANQTDGGAA